MLSDTPGSSEPSVAQLLRFLMVKPAHQGLNPQFGTSAHIFLNLFQDLTGDILSVVGNVLVDSKTSVMTSSISKICRLGLSEVLIWAGLRACIHMGECACVCERMLLYCVLQKKILRGVISIPSLALCGPVWVERDPCLPK